MLDFNVPGQAAMPRLFARNVMLQPPQVLLVVVFAGAMLAIAAEDWRRMRVPDRLVLVACLAGLGAEWISASAFGQESLVAATFALVDGIACGSLLFLLRELHFRLRRVEGMGLGDIKLSVAGGIWLGWTGFAFALFLAALLALAFVASQRPWRGPWTSSRRLPFGTFMAPAAVIVWLFPLI